MRSADASGRTAADRAAAGDFAPDDATVAHATADDGTTLAALRAWLAARDAVLRGLVHALSNRVGTVVAAGGMLEAGSAEVAGRVLGGEAERLETLLAQFRLVTADPFGGEAADPEPVLLTEVVRDALSLYAYAGEGRDVEVTCVGVDAAPPVLVSRVAVVHALLAMLSATDAVRAAPMRAVRAAAVGGGRVAVWTEPAGDAGGIAAAVWLLAGSGVSADARGAVLLPRLAPD